MELVESGLEWIGAGGQATILAGLGLTGYYGWRALGVASMLGGYFKMVLGIIVMLIALPLTGIVDGYNVGAAVDLAMFVWDLLVGAIEVIR